MHKRGACPRGNHGDQAVEQPADGTAARPHGPLVWIHAASVGEATSVLGLIEHLLGMRPSLEVLITTGTVSSANLLETRLPPRASKRAAMACAWWPTTSRR